MTKFVTETAALVLSPRWLPEDPAALPDVFDAFTRIVTSLGRGELAWSPTDDPLRVRHLGDPDHVFRATPLLRDGRTAPAAVPRTCQGRITRQVIAEYFVTPWFLEAREVTAAETGPRWGMRIPITAIEEERQMTCSVIPATTPLVDPVRELMQELDGTVLPVVARVSGAWGAVFTRWEDLDGLMGLKTPGDAWLTRRIARTMTPFRGFWSVIAGWRDAGDGERYLGEWDEPLTVTCYLGWPAYLIAAAGQTASCPACGRTAIQGRRYCGSVDCGRARAADRKRRSRASAGMRPRRAAPGSDVPDDASS